MAQRSTVDDSRAQASGNDDGTGNDEMSANELPGANGRVPVCVTFDEDVDHAVDGQESAGSHAVHHSADHESFRGRYDGFMTPETGTTVATERARPDGAPVLPVFIAPISGLISGDDMDYLARKGAFTVPQPDLQTEILRAYMCSVQPFQPMLEANHFITAVLDNDAGGNISLLLFQAVMFAGLHSLRSDIVLRLGFRSPKQAREVFFNRVRLLYDFNTEPDSAAVLQSLILMSSWYSKTSKWNERRHTWHWTGLAYDLARDIGLHREPKTRYASDRICSFRRRLWWSLYIRDRMIALGTRRPMRIRDDEFDVAMLTLEDFDLEPIDPAHQESIALPDLQENTTLALMCVELAKLCRCIGGIVTSQYTTLGHAGAPHTMMVMPRRCREHVENLDAYVEELKRWHDGLAHNVRRSSSLTDQRDAHSCSEIHWAQLNLTYLTAVNVLHRAQALHTQPDAPESQPAQASSRAKVKDAARSLTKLGQSMHQHDQLRYLGLIGVTALIAASLTHMLDIGSEDEDVRDASTFRLYQSLQVLQALSEIYASADAAVSFLASVTRKAGLPVSAAGPASPANFMSVPSPHGASRSVAQYSQTAGNISLRDWHEQASSDRRSRDGNAGSGDVPASGTALRTAMESRGSAYDVSGRNVGMSSTGRTIDASALGLDSCINEEGFNVQGEQNLCRPYYFPDSSLNPITNPPADGNFFEWNYAMDADGLDFFYSGAYGFLDGQLQ